MPPLFDELPKFHDRQAVTFQGHIVTADIGALAIDLYDPYDVFLINRYLEGIVPQQEVVRLGALRSQIAEHGEVPWGSEPEMRGQREEDKAAGTKYKKRGVSPLHTRIPSHVQVLRPATNEDTSGQRRMRTLTLNRRPDSTLSFTNSAIRESAP